MNTPTKETDDDNTVDETLAANKPPVKEKYRGKPYAGRQVDPFEDGSLTPERHFVDKTVPNKKRKQTEGDATEAAADFEPGRKKARNEENVEDTQV